MLTQTISLDSNTTKFMITCEKSGKKFERLKKIRPGEKEAEISNTETALCDEEIAKFREWMRKESYLKTGCWCEHLEEYKNGILPI